MLVTKPNKTLTTVSSYDKTLSRWFNSDVQRLWKVQTNDVVLPITANRKTLISYNFNKYLQRMSNAMLHDELHDQTVLVNSGEGLQHTQHTYKKTIFTYGKENTIK